IQVAQANHTGNMGDTIPPMGTIDYNWTLGVCEKVKAVVSIPVATVGRVISVENGEKILEEGKADIIGYGRSLLTDPDIANKVATNTPIRECLNCNKGCVDAISSRRYISCVLNAENGDEETIFIKPLITKKKVAVVGGGIAGLEAARVAAVRGHEVTVFEKDNALGGQVILAGMPPRKSEIMRGIAYYEKVLPSLNVTIKLNTVADAATLNQFDEIIVAIGAHNISLPIEGADRANVVNSWDVLVNKVEVNGEVAVIGGGLVGTETAEFLANKGCHVSIIEMTDKIANGESATILPIIKADFKQHDVKEYVNTTVNAINDEGVVAKQNDEVITIKADYVVMAVGSKKNTFDESGIEKPIHYVGDCSGERTADIANAIRTAYKTANEL
ncbi:MAG: FAD-dependent oxidoreductase, partial [Erysipelotrichaceae bacterium]|nr:FAD-dependent oxidoreductase [Erysipelotrichaceae bacterium]